MKINKFGEQQVNFVFSDENTEQQYVIKDLKCTEDQFFEWLENFSYDHLETTYGIHDYSGGEDEDGCLEVGFSSYEISKANFVIVMEIWRKALLDAGFITEDQQVEIIGEEATPIIVITNSMMDYTERYELELVSKEMFDEDYAEDFEEYLNDNLDEDDGFYEFDGDMGDNEYLIQLDNEEDDWEKSFDKAVKKIKKFFKKENIDLHKVE